jgi:hypothetical protein
MRSGKPVSEYQPQIAVNLRVKPAAVYKRSSRPKIETLSVCAKHKPQISPDIDGLRAIAVLSVVSYHAFPLALTGEIFGVDVFFVILGSNHLESDR